MPSSYIKAGMGEEGRQTFWGKKSSFETSSYGKVSCFQIALMECA